VTKHLTVFCNDLFKISGELFQKDIAFPLMHKNIKDSEKNDLFEDICIHLLYMMTVIMAKVYSQKFNLPSKKRYIPLRRYLRILEKNFDKKVKDICMSIDKDIDHKEPQLVYKTYLVQSGQSAEA
jgi:hypothetical protein